MSSENSSNKFLKNYTNDVSRLLLETDYDNLYKIADLFVKIKNTNTRIFTAGNGGSASTASHIVNDLIKGVRVFNRSGFSAECLADSNSVITCLANDFSYEDIFSLQLETKGTSGDILILFSGSGNSPNVIKAAKKAKEMAITTIGFLGRDGGQLLKSCDFVMLAPTWNMEKIEDLHIVYMHALISLIREMLKDTWGIEVISYPEHQFSHVLFDFDGTVSLLREGWQTIMHQYFVEVLMETPQAENKDTLQDIVEEFVGMLTGKQTIFQCMRLAEEVKKRGGTPLEPLEYKKEYLSRLEKLTTDRKDVLINGGNPEPYLVPGTIELLTKLNALGLPCFLASGTDEVDVIREAKLLKIDHFFAGGIFGAKDSESTTCSKTKVVKRLIYENQLEGKNLLSFGDGYVEIELVNSIGGYAIGVASDEVNRQGIDITKRERLIKAGAHAIIPDFKDVENLMKYIKIS